MARLRNTKRVNASPDKTRAVVGDMGGVHRWIPGVTVCRMEGTIRIGLKVGGKVFAMLYKGKLVLKLPQDRVRALVASRDGEPFDPGHGRLMREWVALGQEAKIDWLSLVKEARAFVRAGQDAVRGAARRPQKGERASRAARR